MRIFEKLFKKTPGKIITEPQEPKKIGTPIYTAKVIKTIGHGKGYWDYLDIGVFENDIQIGEYRRNYGSFYNTFFPFKQDDQWYALYSRNYTATRVMLLPSCKDLCGEENNEFGFCPVDYYVPDTQDKLSGTFGFVAGCVWGDDSTFKIQYLDLSDIKNKNLKRDDRFGYISMPGAVDSLKSCISLHWYDSDDDDQMIEIATATMFNLKTGKRIGEDT